MLGALTIAGCGESTAEALGTTQQGVYATPSSINFSRNGVSITSPRQSEADVDAGLRIGYGIEPTAISTYNFALASDGRKPWSLLETATMLSMERPSRVWIVPPSGGPEMSVIATDIMTGRVNDTALGEVFPGATQQSRRPVGPVATLSSDTSKFVDAAKSSNTAYALMSDNASNLTIHHAYLPLDEWRDFALPLGNSNSTPCGSGATPYTSPQAIRRKATLTYSECQDSIVYGCGATSPAQACEHRRGGPAHSNTYYACFGSGSSFVSGTRPVAFADAGSFSSVMDFGTGERWIFATINSSATQKKVVALRETSSVTSNAQPTYAALKTIDTQTNTAVLSSPMPIMYKDANNTTTLAIFYLRKIGNDTTRLVEAKTTNFTSWSVAEILDTRVSIPVANEPSPYYQVGQPGLTDQLRVQFRLPVGSSTTEVRDIVEVVRQPDGTYVKTVLPLPWDTAGLYAVQDSSATLFQIDQGTGARTAVGTGWSGVTAFATDGVGLGYAVKGADLWEINLNDNVSRKIGTENWTGTTHLVFGYHQSFGVGKDSYPRLWAVRSGNLRRIDLATGASTNISTFNNGVKLLASSFNRNAFLLRPTTYLIDGAGTLFIINSLTNAFTTGTTGAWAEARAMTVNPVTGHLYIAKGPDGSGTHRLYRLDLNGTVLGQSSTFSNAQWLATIKGNTYLMKSRRVSQIGGTGSSVTLSAMGVLWEDYTVTGMVGRSY